jgi:hypothetical protein
MPEYSRRISIICISRELQGLPKACSIETLERVQKISV